MLAALVDAAGPTGMVHVDLAFVEALQERGLSHVELIDSLELLMFLEQVEREADEIYRVTALGYAAAPAPAPPEGNAMTLDPTTPNDPRSSVQQQEEDEMRLLRAIVEATGGSSAHFIQVSDAYTRAQLDYERGERARRFLLDEGLLKGRTDRNVTATHEGLREYRDAVKHPERETDHFSPATISVVINGPNYGAIQTGGSGNAATIANTSTVGADPKSIVDAIAEMRALIEGMPEAHAADAREVVDAIEVQASSTKKNIALVKGYAEALKNYAELAPYAVAILHLLGVTTQ